MFLSLKQKSTVNKQPVLKMARLERYQKKIDKLVRYAEIWTDDVNGAVRVHQSEFKQFGRYALLLLVITIPSCFLLPFYWMTLTGLVVSMLIALVVSVSVFGAAIDISIKYSESLRNVKQNAAQFKDRMTVLRSISKFNVEFCSKTELINSISLLRAIILQSKIRSHAEIAKIIYKFDKLSISLNLNA